jgi:acetyl-CoA/propionyl-CoA carboxylase biotin carboxyl carrier protein
MEEAPAPALPDGVEEEMGAAAVKAAKAVGYFNAGTVEFIYQDEEFFFLEMNTRLQVEHPVTELITGIDLVEWQIRVASGEKLPMTQKQVLAARRGHAIEVRINAENPTAGKFLPSPGTITKLTTPDGFGVRFDGGYESGDTVSQYYDNLIGKLIVWGKDRETAIARTIRALEETKIEGLHTTIQADLAILRHPDFAATKHSTKWVEETLDLSKIISTTGETQANSDGLVEKNTVVEVNGKRFDVKVWVPPFAGTGSSSPGTKTLSTKPQSINSLVFIFTLPLLIFSCSIISSCVIGFGDISNKACICAIVLFIPQCVANAPQLLINCAFASANFILQLFITQK